MTSLATLKITNEVKISVKDYLTRAKAFAYSQYNIRQRMIDIDRSYMRETNLTSENEGAKQANAQGDSTKIQDVSVPIIQSQVESALTYQASVFLTGVPIFGVVSAPETMEQAMQLEAKIDADSVRCGYVQEILDVIRNGLKYRYGAAEVVWDTELEIRNDTDISEKDSIKAAKVEWAGNKLKSLDMYNTFYDIRFCPSEVATRGEFAGYSEIITNLELISFFEKDPYALKQLKKEAAESPVQSLVSSIAASDTQSYFIPQISSTHSVTPRGGGFDWSAWLGLTQAGVKKVYYKDTYLKTVIYCRIVPARLNLDVPSPNTPQIWRFVLINDSVIVAANPVVTYRDMLPILFFVPKKDGLKYQTKSFAEDSLEFQAAASALMASNIAARRRAISDRTLFDPSRVDKAAINSANPSAKIPVKPAAYGKPLNEAVFPFPFRDDQQNIISSEISSLINMANAMQGQNAATQGQFVKGNKTRQEFDSIMANARSKDQVIAMLAEAQFFTPLKELLKFNILANDKGSTSVYSRSQEKFITLDKVAMRRAMLQFKVSDGLIPSQKLLSGDAFGVAMQTLMAAPIGAEYNVGKIFSYLMKTQGADLSFAEKSEEQKAYEQALGAWQNAIAGLMQSTQKDQIANLKFPPQPLPEQFKYDPSITNKKMQQNTSAPLLAQTTNALSGESVNANPQS
jgi:hypothetical protein